MNLAGFRVAGSRNRTRLTVHFGRARAPKHRGKKRKPRPWRSRPRNCGGGGPRAVPATQRHRFRRPSELRRRCGDATHLV